MTQIRPWGKLLAQDPAGYLINDCHIDKILPPWTLLVEELRQRVQPPWSTRLQALYLRGSVPRGLALPQVSDLDSFAILSGEILDTDRSLARQICSQLQKRYLFCLKVELILLTQADIEQHYSIWPSIIQIQSLKIAGEDLPLTLPQFEPGSSLINYAYTWEKDLGQTLNILAQLSPQDARFSAQVKKQCRWIMRRMVRTGYELVMEQDQSYTPDLYYCYQRFALYFPEQQRAMHKALQLALFPSAHRPGLIVFLRGLGRWLVEQVKQRFRL
ncbi:hypothetical protein [Roseofilum capinflatum]|uniref:Nucleotidyltransferase domain-containing protein n=1 Tax=Roseofilum capinflatum BLCC-M114 TaxID=3022440 RepID=A0ABT7B0G1_9CYAN|nr:hypothetical protein [Roseofilum capinflatum]MDJ1172653.1 hypothetical protein [Roseofilum capinflatum BLCC-M114]